MLEKRWIAVPPQLFTADGTSDGKVTVLNSTLFKVKQIVILASGTVASSDSLEIKRITDLHTIYIGPKHGNIDARTDVSALLVADGAFIAANEQPRCKVPEQDVERATFEEEPVVARRVIGVDQLGNPYNAANPFPVAATFDGDVKVGDIRITAHDDDPKVGDIHSSVRIGGTNPDNELDVNSDGSINVNIINSPDNPGLTLSYSEITSVGAGIETTIITVVAPQDNYRVQKIDVSGDNVAVFKVKLDGTTIMTKRTWWMHFNEIFDFEDFVYGLKLSTGQTISVTCLHNSPDLGSFEATVAAMTN